MAIKIGGTTVIDDSRNITNNIGTIPASKISGSIPIGNLSTATTQAESDNSTKIATTAYVTNKITTLIGGAPSTLNDLNELAAAINDDANYNTTLTTALSTKLPLAGGTITGDVLYNDNIKAKFGASSDLQLYHDPSVGSIIKDVGAGSLFIRASTNIQLEGNNGENMAIFNENGSVQLYYDNAERLTTTPTGIDVNGYIFANDLFKVTGVGTNTTYSADELALSGFGIMGNRSNLYITNSSSSGVIKLGIGGVHNTANKLTIASSGVTVAGNVAVSGTVDGRDVATDGTKLDGIESGATADQTAGQILTAIKTVDGASSGLDADLLDGQQGSYYMPASTTTIAQSHYVSGSAFSTTAAPDSVLEYAQSSGITDTKVSPTSDWYNSIRMGHGDPYTYYSNTIAVRMTGTSPGDIYTQTISTGNGQGWKKHWNDGNDGSGSGLNADLLDGLHASSFATSAQGTTADNALPKAGGTMTGNLTVGGSGSTGNAFAVDRGSDSNNAFRVLNSGEVVVPSNYFYASATGTSMYVQNDAVFRGNIRNDTAGQPVTITDDLAVSGTVDGVDIAARNGVLTTTTNTANAALPKAGGTVTGVLTVNDRVNAHEIRTNNGQELILNAGESSTYATGQTAEQVYLNSEGGVQISSSPDNWASGWAGRNTTTISNSAGDSSFGGNIAVSGNITGVSDLYVADQIIHTGDTNTYMQFHAGDQWRVVTGGTERLEVNNDTMTVAATLSMNGHDIDMNNNNIAGVNRLTHEGDSNTWHEFHAADQWRVVTGGTERLEVNNSQITSAEPIHAPSFHGDGSALTGVGGASLAFTNAGNWTVSNSFTTFSGGTNGLFFQASGSSSGGNQNANRARQTIGANGNGTWYQVNGSTMKIGGENHYIQAGNASASYTAFGYVAPGGNLVTNLGAGNSSTVSVRYRAI